jgi:general secretion pathway protein C
MLRGLWIRQGFLVVDLLLTGLLAVVALLVVFRLFSPTTAEGVADAGPPEVDPVAIGGVAERETYAAVVDSGMFGLAGTRSAEAPPEPEPTVQEEVTDTTLDLALYGTVAASPRDPLGTAIIENRMAASPRRIDTYYVGETIIDQRILYEIYPNYVVLLDKATGQKELLKQDENTEVVTASAAGRPAAAVAVEQEGPNQFKVRKDELVAALSQNPQELVQTLNPQPVKDNRGNVIGYTSDNVSGIDVARKIGLQDGDVVQKVNGITIDSPEKISEVAYRFRNLNTFRLSIQRNGRQQMLTLNLE